VTPLRVLLVDDHALVRSGLRALLEALPGVAVAGEASTGREALRLAADAAPDVVLMDITMPDMNGLTALEHLRRARPGVAVVMVSMHADRAYVDRALGAGARGYVPKNAGRAELSAALGAVAQGRTYVSPAAGDVPLGAGLAAGEAAGGVEALTPRQREILQLIAEGHTTRDIAARLGVSVKTAESHRTELMRRVGVHEIAGLVRYAIRVGLVSAER